MFVKGMGKDHSYAVSFCLNLATGGEREMNPELSLDSLKWPEQSRNMKPSRLLQVQFTCC